MSNKIHIDPKVRETIKLVKNVVFYVLSYWYLLIIFILIAFFLGKLLKRKPVDIYQADLTFTINQQETNDKAESDVARLITEFSSGGSKDNSGSSIKLIELSQSYTVLTEVLFRRYVINGTEDYLANHYINIYDLGIEDSSFFKNFTKVDSLSRNENFYLKKIINDLKRNNIRFTVSPAQIFKITTFSINEEFSKLFTEGFYKAHSELYVKGAVAKAQANYDFTEERLLEATDKLLSTERQLANWIDANHNLSFRTPYLRQVELERSVEIYNEVYIEALKSFEVAKVRRENQRPIFQLVDPPTYPLLKTTDSNRRIGLFAQLGAITFFLFITLSLYFYKEYNYLIKELFEE